MGGVHIDVLKVLFDVLCFFIFAIPLWVYNLVEKAVPLTKNGFFCGDLSIHYPYRNSSISSTVMFISGCGMLLLSVLIIETLLYRRCIAVLKTSYFHPLLCNIYRAMGYGIIGACINQFLTDIGKMAIGRLRPHFLDICQPNVQCNATDPYLYIEDYECTRTSHPLIPPQAFHKRMDDARKSFPSGHASFSFYMAMFIVLYIEYRMTAQRTRLLRHLVQTGVMAWAVWICSSRILDFKHRFSDVAAGIVIGTTVAVCMMRLYWASSRKPYTIEMKVNGIIHDSPSSRREGSLAPGVVESSLSVTKEDV